jgi:hypothetical protein
VSACEVCGTEKPAKYDWTGWNKSPREQRGWRIVCWSRSGDDSGVTVLHESEACRDALLALLNERSEANRYHQALGAKWMCEAFVREVEATYSQNRHAREWSEHLKDKWQDSSYWRKTVPS